MKKTDLNKTLEHMLPISVRVSITIDDIGLKSNLKTNQTLIFTERFFFFTNLGFTQSHLYALDDINGFYQLIAGPYRGKKPVKIAGMDNVHLQRDCVLGCIVNGVREPVLCSFALGHKIFKEPTIKLFRKMNKSVLSNITVYLEDDDHKPFDFHNDIISITCQVIET